MRVADVSVTEMVLSHGYEVGGATQRRTGTFRRAVLKVRTGTTRSLSSAPSTRAPAASASSLLPPLTPSAGTATAPTRTPSANAAKVVPQRCSVVRVRDTGGSVVPPAHVPGSGPVPFHRRQASRPSQACRTVTSGTGRESARLIQSTDTLTRSNWTKPPRSDHEPPNARSRFGQTVWHASDDRNRWAHRIGDRLRTRYQP
jgi:hypothetical protein